MKFGITLLYRNSSVRCDFSWNSV